ncbi:MAG: tetratricopeptide repeat protein, partial [Rubrobacter sp.]
ELSRAHALYYLALAESAQPEVSAPLQAGVWALLDEEYDNLRAALRWAIRRREAEIGTELGLTLWRFWASRIHMSEGRQWLEAVLALGAAEDRTAVAEPPLPARRWAFLHLVAGILASAQGDYDRAVVLFEESLALYQDLGDRKGTSGPLRELGIVAYHRGDYERAVRLNEQALAISREFGSSFGAALTIYNLSDALRAQGDHERAWKLLEESLASVQSQKYPLRVAYARAATLARLGSIECEFGDVERASELYARSLDIERRFEFKFEAVASLEGLARVSAMQGRPEQAARILGVSAALREELGTLLTPIARADHDHAVDTARAALGDDAFEAAWAVGHALSLEGAVALAVGDD